MTVAVNDDALDAFWAYYTDVVKKKYNNRVSLITCPFFLSEAS